jgi:hypothetical protein
MVEICDQVMAGLSYFPWNGGNCSVCGMVCLLTNSYLSNFHIDYTLTKISHHHCNHHGVKIFDHHVFLTVFDLDSIVAACLGGICNACVVDKCTALGG